MNVERELDILRARLIRIEDKVDRLLDFRGWVLGAVAALATSISTAVALAATWITAK